MKVKLIAYLLILVSNTVLADAGKFLVGHNYSHSLIGKAMIDFDGGEDSVTEDLNISSLSIFVGYQTARNNRFQISLTRTDYDYDDFDIKEEATGIDFDWQFVYARSRVKPYWGIGFGLHRLDDPLILRGTDKDGDSLDGLSFQLGTGVKIQVVEFLEFDASYKVKAVVWEQVDVDLNFGGSESRSSIYTDDALNIGLAFKF